MTRKRVLITGGAGFVGGHLMQRLIAEGGYDILAVDNFSRGRKDAELDRLLGNACVKVASGDLTDPKTFAQFTGEFDQVYHFAAVIGVRNVLERPDEVVRVNAMATLHLLDWLSSQSKKPKALFASTSEAYAWTKLVMDLPVPTPENVPLALTDLANPRASYAGSKIFGELAFHQYGKKRGFPYAIVRYHNVYGPRMGYEHVIPEIWERASAGQNPLTVYSSHHLRAFCYVEDAIEATWLAMEKNVSENTFNIGNDREEYSIEQLARLILTIAGRPNDSIKDASAANDPIARRLPNISRACELLGYNPTISLKEGLERTIAWYKQNPRPSNR